MTAELIGALLASVYGCCTVFRKKTPLFYKIVFYAVLTCLMGSIYTVLYDRLWVGADTGFQIGYLGYIGMFFFLYSSYYGAINSLADDGQPGFRRYRILSGIITAAFITASVLLLFLSEKDVWTYITVIPMSFTVYFAVKHLIIPDVDMGIICVMRPYNALIVSLCVCMMLRLLSASGSITNTVCSIITGILLAACLPTAKHGVQKWFT